MPSCETRNGAKFAIDLPSRRMSPPLGPRLPAMTLNKVVLPAPLAPMRPTNSPRSTLKLTSSTALSPPKVFVTFCNSRSAMSLLAATVDAARHRGEQAEQALGQRQHERDQQASKQDHVDQRKAHPQRLRKANQEQRAEQRGSRSVAAADNRDADHRQGYGRIENSVGLEVARTHQHDSAYQPGNDCRDGEGDHLVLDRWDSDCSRSDFVLTDGSQARAETGISDDGEQHDGGCSRREKQPIDSLQLRRAEDQTAPDLEGG